MWLLNRIKRREPFSILSARSRSLPPFPLPFGACSLATKRFSGISLSSLSSSSSRCRCVWSRGYNWCYKRRFRRTTTTRFSSSSPSNTPTERREEDKEEVITEEIEIMTNPRSPRSNDGDHFRGQTVQETVAYKRYLAVYDRTVEFSSPTTTPAKR